MKIVAALAVTTTIIASQTAQARDASLAFVSCPVVRDTSTVPCWLSEYDGQLYYLGIQTDVSADFSPPSLGHKVLVEGTVSSEPDICGGQVLKPVKISVLPELAPECNTMLTAEPRYELPFEPPRPPGPSNGRLAFSPPERPALPTAPFPEKTFTIQYDFDGTVNFQTPRSLTPVLEYAQHVEAGRVEITGHRAAVELTGGDTLVERDGLGRIRAEQIAELLQGAGLTEPEYVVRAMDEAEIGGPEVRRVTIRIVPIG